MHEKQTQCTLAPLGLQSTCCLQKWAMVACQELWQNKNNQKDHSPPMALSKLPKMIKSLKKIAKDTWHYCYHGLYDDPRLSC